MKPENLLAWIKLIAVIVVLAGIAWFFFRAKSTAEKALTALTDNPITRGVSNVGGFLFGTEKSDSTLGTWFFDITHPKEGTREIIAVKNKTPQWTPRIVPVLAYPNKPPGDLADRY